MVISDGQQSTGVGGDGYTRTTDRAGEIYDQLLNVGKQFAAAYVDAHQKTAEGIAEFQGRVAERGWSSGPSAGLGGYPLDVKTADLDLGESIAKARTRALEITENLQTLNKKLMLAFLNAYELAALAVADCQEELTQKSDVELVKTVGGAGVKFRRELTKAYASAAREIVGRDPR
jgi:hypothetical protein